MFQLLDGRTELWQWDSDRKVVISDATVSEVHFCNKTDECSLVVEVYEEEGQRLANIPNILLQTDWPIHVYAYCGDGYTRTGITFKVNRRSRPASYVYTETEIKRWEKLEEEIKADMEALEAEVKADMEALEERVNTEISDARHEFGSAYANAIPKTVKEQPAFGINDVSPAPHTITIETAPGATVKVGGKNVLDYTKAKAYRGSVEIIDGGVRWKADSTYYFSIPCELPKGTTIAGSFTHNGTGTDAINNMRVKYKSGGSNNIAVVYNNLTLTDDIEAIYIYKNSPGTALTKDVEITNIQLEIGMGDTEYEPYIEPTIYTAGNDGKLTVGSFSPSMSFITADEEETKPDMDITYNRDINAVINELTQAIISLGGNV